MKVHYKYSYLVFFFLSCVVFWWMPILLNFFPFQFQYSYQINSEILFVSFVVFLLFAIGYFLGVNKKILIYKKISTKIVNNVANLSRYLNILIIIPSLVLAIRFFLIRLGMEYGEGVYLPFLYQVVFYLHLSLFFVYLTTTNDYIHRKKTFWIITFSSILVRLIVSLVWGRFFLGQIVVATILVFLVRGIIKITFKRIFLLIILGLFIYLFPAYTRGDFRNYSDFNAKIVYKFVSFGSTLKLFQDNLNLNLNSYCNPLVVSVTAKTIPYKLIDECTIDIWGIKSLPATLDRILARKELGLMSMSSLAGPGSNFMLELYLSLGGYIGVLFGSFAFGYFAGLAYRLLAIRSIFGVIWLEFLVRGLFAPRSNLGYAVERIPMLILFILILVLIVSANSSHSKLDVEK